ncbi:type I-C CRISPR-associated protein Cas8c/Csd1 [Nonomuraea ferruginea]|uniref:Type I-C CRISPR-associated protein Cas8c/Csd1 n=1 Tax=Nonomuraea ferruginea TaxID=46174 RepID=A0ABT4TBC9_9ACTN|nr:type I-C CRISPR-associated protein Cas8c/Csd1 [Nonomuraea ferruginea]MDA0646475.1 type I-C CRISPR-associated protein Cas8c/Csd1 [Nonomuraea ferruginea]
MLIQRLAEHAETAVGDKTPRYFRNRAVRWAITLTRTGKLSLISRADADHKQGSPLPTPYLTRTSGVAAMLLVDTLEYGLAVAKDDTDKAQAGADRRNDAYLDLLEAWAEASADPIAELVWETFKAERHLDLLQILPEDAKSSDLIGILVDGEWAHLRPSAIGFWAQVARERKSSGRAGLCLVCAQVGPLLKTIPEMVKSTLIPVGLDPSGRPKRGRDAALISVNTAAQGRMSTLQLANTPLCEQCGSAAMAGLADLLSNDQHRRRGDDTVLIWWLRDPDPFNPLIIDAPHLKDVERLLQEVWRGRTGTVVDDNAFYAVTLSANQSRIVVRDWLDVPLPEIKRRIAAWFSDHGSTQMWEDGVHYVPLRQMARASGRWHRGRKAYDPGSAAHGLERDLLHAALHQAALPSSLVPHLLHRIRNDHHVDLPRVALLRLALNRPPYKENIMTGLDETSTDPAYVWGRLFAVLEAIQRRALPDTNATIRDRYFGLAMTQPATTMRMLRTNANGHLKKLIGKETSRAAGFALDGRLATISQLIDHRTGLPAHLDARGQVQFILGYDHQRAHDMAAARAAKAAKAATDEALQS